jgi:hypothetical protein
LIISKDIIYGMDFKEMKEVAIMEFKKYIRQRPINPTKSFIVRTANNEKIYLYTNLSS